MDVDCTLSRHFCVQGVFVPICQKQRHACISLTTLRSESGTLCRKSCSEHLAMHSLCRCRCSCSPLVLFEPALSGLQAWPGYCLAHQTSQCANTPECTQTTAAITHIVEARNMLMLYNLLHMLQANTMLHGLTESRATHCVAARHMTSSYRLLHVLTAIIELQGSAQ